MTGSTEYIEYLLDNMWADRDDIDQYKIYYLQIKEDEYYIGFTGLSTKTDIVKPKGTKIYKDFKMEYLFNGNYDKCKQIYLWLLTSNCLVDDKCDGATLSKLMLAFNMLKN